MVYLLLAPLVALAAVTLVGALIAFWMLNALVALLLTVDQATDEEV